MSNKKTGFGFAGFSMSPPKKPMVKAFSEEDEGDDLDGEDVQEPAAAPKQDDDEVDPLDAFMAGVQAEVAKASTAPAAPKARIAEFEDEDPVESYIKHKQAVGKAAAAAAAATVKVSADDSDEDVYAAAKAIDGDAADYDSDDAMLLAAGGKKKIIEPIPALDHSQIKYADFEKNFYTENEDIALMTEQEVDAYRKELEIKITGPDPVRPVKTFNQLGFDETLSGDIAKQGYTEPTPIQRQALPVALSGRDIIGIAQTGSGKTAAFVLPMIVHIMDQPDLEKGEGPIAVICAPTRELAQQIYLEAKKFAKSYGIRVAAVYGGLSKNDQFRELKAGTEVIVATPGRLIDMIKGKACKMNRTTYLVLDEADRMFDMGFEPQVRSIVGQIRPDRQTLLFSATFKRSVEKLARDILLDPLRINIGSVGEANVDIKQEIIVLNSDAEKWPWLMPRLQDFVDDGSVIIFVSTKIASEELSKNLVAMGFHSAALHGDKDQTEREKIMFAFKNENLPILVATDVAARGLDIKTIRNVVNYDIARDIDSHTHRIGRTGRAGQLGVAWTLITLSQTSFACELLRSLEMAGQIIPPQLTELAMKDSRFSGSRSRRGGGGRGAPGGRGGPGGGRGGGRGRGRGANVGGAGLGYDDGPSEPGHRNDNGHEGGVFGRGRGAVMAGMRGAMSTRFQSSFVRADSSSEEDGGSMRANKVARLIPPPEPQSYDQPPQSYQQQPPSYQQQPPSYQNQPPPFQQQQSQQSQSQQQQRTHKYDNERYNNLPFNYTNQNTSKPNYNNRYHQPQQQQQNLPPQLLQMQQQLNQQLAQQSKSDGNEAYDPFSAGDDRDNGRGGGRDSRDRDRDYRDRDRDRDRDYRDRDRDRERDRDRDRDYRDRDRERDRGDRERERDRDGGGGGRKRSSSGWDK